MNYISSEHTARNQAFETLVEHTQHAYDAVAVDQVDPTVAARLPFMKSVADNLFLPDISSDGLVSIPDAYRNENAYPLIPAHADGELFRRHDTALESTPYRLGLIAARYNVSAEDVAAKTNATRRSDTKFGLEYERHNTDPIHTVAVADSPTVTNLVPGKKLPLKQNMFDVVPRPIIVTSPDLLKMDPLEAGSIVVHEIVHVEQNEHSDNRAIFAPRGDKARRAALKDELEAYNVQAGIVSGKNMGRAMGMTYLNRAFGIDFARVQNVDPAHPFDANAKVQAAVERYKI